MLMDVVDGDAAHVPILWGEVKGWNSIEELLFLDVNGKKFRLLGHLKNGPSDVLWNTVNQF